MSTPLLHLKTPQQVAEFVHTERLRQALTGIAELSGAHLTGADLALIAWAIRAYAASEHAKKLSEDQRRLLSIAEMAVNAAEEAAARALREGVDPPSGKGKREIAFGIIHRYFPKLDFCVLNAAIDAALAMSYEYGANNRLNREASARALTSAAVEMLKPDSDEVEYMPLSDEGTAVVE